MTSLEKRLFHLFDKADIAKGKTLGPVRISCPRVGQVRATIADESGESQDVLLELSAGRRGGMTLETTSTTDKGRHGKPCAALAAVLLEVDRRGIFSSIHDHTPVALQVVPADDVVDEDEAFEAEEEPVEEGTPPSKASASTARSAAGMTAAVARPVAKPGARQPAWAMDLEERRRLVEPAMRAPGLAIADGRRSAGALVFLLDIGASSDSHAAVLVPSRMQLDVAGNASGRPRPIVIGPGQDAEYESLDSQERSILSQLVGTAAVGELGSAESLERRTIARIAVSPQAAPAQLALLCETGRLVIQPEPRRSPETV
ncbi:MAG: hypothetical protein WCJ31_22055, partial [Planctomycetia bacterium]